MRFILDCDPGLDDAIAILSAAGFSSSGAELLAITTTWGNVSAEKTYRNAKIVAGLANIRCPVFFGERTSIKNEIYSAKKVHGEDGLGGFSEKYKRYYQDSKTASSVEFIKNLKKFRIIATGPLTNIAKVLMDSPEIEQDIEEIVWMGGALFTSGNTTSHSEFNAYCDPDALEIVLNSKIPLTVVPLDVTLKTYIRKEDFRNLISDVSSEIKEFLEDITSVSKGITLHDPLAVTYFFKRDILKTVRANIKVDTKCFRGKTTATVLPWGRAEIAYEINRKLFFETLRNSLERL